MLYKLLNKLGIITHKNYEKIFKIIDRKLFDMYANEAPYSDTDITNEFKQNIEYYLNIVNIKKDFESDYDIEKVVKHFRKWVNRNWNKLYKS